MIGSVSLFGLLAPPSQAQVMQPMPVLNAQEMDRLRAFTSRLRCLVCQGEAVADSNSEFSQEVRRQVAVFFKNGKTEAEVEQFYAARYGDSILLEPPKKGLGTILWGVPILVLMAGMGLWWNVLGRKSSTEIAPEMLERVEREMLERDKSVRILEIRNPEIRNPIPPKEIK